MRRAPALAALLLMAGPLAAGLSNATLSGPATVSGGQAATLVLNVSNNSGTTAVDAVQPTLGFVSNGYAPSVSGPSPASYSSVAAGASVSFTWIFNGNGCGTADFSASASGTESSVPVSSNTANYQVSLYCTPTPTPTATPVLSPTPTAWVVHVDSVAPGAQIRGNLFHPLLGQPLQLEASLPEAGALNVEIFDRLGKKQKSFSLNAGPGLVSLAWDGRGDDGLLVSSGIYAAQFRARGLNVRVKFAVIK